MVNRDLAEAIIGSLQLSGTPYDFPQLTGSHPVTGADPGMARSFWARPVLPGKAERCGC